MPQLPAGWEETTLQLCTLPVQEKISLTQVSEDNYISTENMLPNIWWVVISSGLPNINSITKFQKWDILFSNIRTYFRKLWYATFTGGVSNDVLVFRGNYSKIYSKFLFYRLSDNSFFDYTIKTSKWTKMPRWDKEAIWNFPIHLPPPPRAASYRSSPQLLWWQDRAPQSWKSDPWADGAEAFQGAIW